MTVPQTETSPAWQNFLDLSNDTKPYLQIPATDTTNDVVLQTYIDAGCWWVQEYLGRPIAPTTFFRRFNGYSGFGGSMIDLPYYPVLGVPVVTEYWGASGGHTLVLQTPEAQGGSDMYTLDSLRGIITRSYLGLLARPFFPGLKNVEVTWVAGFNPVPPTVRLATLEYVKYWWSNTQQSSRSFQPRPQYGDIDSNVRDFDEWPGVEAKIKAMLRPFLQVGVA